MKYSIIKNIEVLITEVDRVTEQIEYGLKKVQKREDILRLAWRWAVDVLPYLGFEGNLNFWNIYLQRNLYYVLNAIDSTLLVSTRRAINAHVGANRIAGNFTNSPKKSSRDVAKLIAAAAASAANARADARASFRAAETFRYANLVIIAAGINPVDFQKKAQKDISIKLPNKYRPYINEKHLEVWNNFDKLLRENECTYWANWYQKVLKKKLILDEEDIAEVRMRANQIPEEIRSEGAAVIGNYIERIKSGSERLNEARILILGDKGAGKTCLARRLKDPNMSMTTDAESTLGVDTTLWKLKKENINIHIWDFAGHTVTHAVHQFFLSERCLYIIVFDGRTEDRNRLEYWLDHMKNYGKNSQAIIFVNKRDNHAVEIPVNRLKEQYPILDVVTFSIRDDKEALEIFRKKIADYINTNPSWNNQLIPESSFKVKTELEELFNKKNKDGRELITLEEFLEISQKYGVTDSETLLNDLHTLGISLWYKDLIDFGTLVLNPEWISNGVYRIINWAHNEKKFCLSIKDFITVFSKESKRYPKSEHRFLFELMKKYELAYEAKEDDILIIPRLLKEDQPVNLPKFLIGKSLMARYKADQPLMSDTISRFIVKHNQEITIHSGKYQVWRYGVILNNNSSIALVREEDDRTITVSVKGANKTEYLSTLRETLNGIFESYKSKKPELQYRVERFGNIPIELEKQAPLWLADHKILNHALDNIPYYDDSTRQSINLNNTVNNYNVTAQTFLSGTGNQYLDQSIHNTFNFRECNINLQGDLNDLARHLLKNEYVEVANELKEVAMLLAETEECLKPEEVKKKGILRSLQLFAERLSDEESSLSKTINGIEKGINIAQDIAKGYNKIAQWLVLPQIPNIFL